MICSDDRKKILIATDISLESVERLVLVQKSIQAAAPEGAKFRWQDPANIRISFLYFPDLSPDVLPLVSTSLAEMVKPLFPFDVHIQRVFAFPSVEKPRIFYAGIDPSGGEVISLLRKRMLMVLPEFDVENSRELKFIPSVFLGRAMSCFDATEAIQHVEHMRAASSPIRAITLLESITQKHPPAAKSQPYPPQTYRVLRRFGLGK